MNDDEIRTEVVRQRTVMLAVRCRTGDFGERHRTRAIIAGGVRVNVAVEACKAWGTFTSTVTKCDRPLFNNDEGELEVGAVVPVDHLASVEAATECKLRVSQYVVADCQILSTSVLPK